MSVDHKQRIIEVLGKSYLMSLGTIDDGGVWVADVKFIYDKDLNIYWMSSPNVRHSKAIMLNPKVAVSITVTSQSGEDNLGIQFSGIAEKIDGPRYDLAVKHFAKSGRPQPSEDEDVLCGSSWYVVKTNKIELIDDKNFGFRKQIFEI